MKAIKEFLKPNLIKVLLTFLFGIIVFLIGAFWFNNPVFLKTGCAPNPGCPYCEICMPWGFPGIINFTALLTFIFLYLLSCLVYRISRRAK